jgi:methionine-S-sulfoxide reductase
MTKILKEQAILAGGCFWGMQDILRKISGVLATRVGYTGGSTPQPTYEDVCSGQTGHAEAIEIEFDPTIISYKELLAYFFKMHDPTTPHRQMNDVGSQYRSAIFYLSPEQKAAALETIQAPETTQFWENPIVTEVNPAGTFYPAEDHHQDYLEKNPHGYSCHYLRKR